MPEQVENQEQAQPATQPQSETPAASSWQDGIKTADRNEVYTTLGLSDFQKNLLNNWDKPEGIQSLVELYNNDPEKMDAADLMRRQIAEEYAGMAITPEALKRMQDKRLAEYKTEALSNDPEDVEEAELERLRLQKDTAAYREKQKQQRAERLQQTAPKPNPEQEKAVQVLQQRQEYIDASDVAKSILADKQLVVGEGEDAFHITIDNPELTLQMVKAFQTADDTGIMDKQGNPDVFTAALVAEISRNPLKIIQDAIAHGGKLNKKAEILAAENARGQQPQQSGVKNPTTYDRMAANGRVVA